MNIKIVPDPKNPKLRSIYVNEDLWKTVHISIFPDISRLSTLEVFPELEYKGARQFLIRRLSLRNYGSPQLQKMLKERLVSPDTIHRALEDLKRAGFIDDKTWEESLVRGLQSKHLGPKMIAYKLKSKGINTKPDSTGQEESIVHLLRTRYRSRDLADFKEKRRVMMSLYRRGFDLEIISKIVN